MNSTVLPTPKWSLRQIATRLAAHASGSGLARAALIVTACTMAAKVIALGKDMLVAARFGNSAELDSFLLAFAFPSFLVSIAAGTLPAALTPAFVRSREREGAARGNALAAHVLRRAYLLLALLTVVAVLVCHVYAAVPANGLSDGVRRAVPVMALWLAPFTLLQGVCTAWIGLLAADRRFAIGAFAPALQSFGMMFALAFGVANGLVPLVVGLHVGTLLQALWLARAMRARGLPLWRAPEESRYREETTRAMPSVRAQYLPAVASALLLSATTIVDQTMAAVLPPGSVSALGYGNKLSALLMSVGALALGTTLLPHLSVLVARSEWGAIRASVRRVAAVILALTVPVTIAGIVFGEAIVRLLFERGAFTATESVTVASVQTGYLLQLPVHLLGILFVRLVSALGANRVLTLSAFAGLVVNVILNLLFMREYGVAGIALSTAGVYSVTCVILGVAAYRALGQAEQRHRLLAAHGRDEEGACASAA